MYIHVFFFYALQLSLQERRLAYILASNRRLDIARGMPYHLDIQRPFILL